MKYFKILAVILGIVGLTACNEKDKPEWNSASGVTVSMLDTEISFKESRGIISVPFVVNGDPNGYITVSCEVREYGESVAMDDVHYIITTKTVNVAPDSKEGHFEISLVDDYEVNDDRQFTITLIDPKKCQLGTTTTTLVTLKDNDNDPYERLEGLWYMHCVNDSEQIDRIPVRIKAADEGELAYYHTYKISGLFSDPNTDEDCPLTVDFEYDVTTREGSISIPYGQKLPDYEYDQYGTGTGLFGWGTNPTGTASFTWNENVSKLELLSWPGNDPSGAVFTYFLTFGVGRMIYSQYTNIDYFSRKIND